MLLISLAFLCTSCFFYQSGRWVNGVCRPKEYNFKVLKTPFKETDKLNFNKVYVGNPDFTGFGYGFYPDGRLIFITSDDGFALKEKDVTGKTWDNTVTVGYWRADENKIKVEFFICKDGGYYIEKKGEIKGDTIVFYQGGYFPFRKDVWEERYVLSDMEFGEISN